MCQLDNIISLFQKAFNDKFPEQPITDDIIEYKWKQDGKQWNEKKVNDYFWILRGEVLSALIRPEEKDIIAILEKVVRKWGGIKKVGKETYNNYAKILKILWKEQDGDYFVGNNNDKMITIDYLCPVCYSYYNTVTKRWNHKAVTPLSTWTKVLAAYDPTRFWIYDARVALALRFLGYNWFIPESRSYLSTMKKLLNRNAYNTQDELQSYRLYLDLLLQQENNRQSATKIIKTASHFEKRLFMLGGAIRDRYKVGNDATKNAIIRFGCERQNAQQPTQ